MAFEGAHNLGLHLVLWGFATMETKPPFDWHFLRAKRTMSTCFFVG